MSITNAKRSGVGKRRRTIRQRLRTAEPTVEPLVLRAHEVAKLLGIGERKVWSLIAENRLTVSRIDRLTLVHVASVRALLSETATE
jgi:hypothetical protein